jgi:dTDP-glucose pyrophosphorylase
MPDFVEKKLMKKVLVAGGAGFIGSAVVRQFIATLEHRQGLKVACPEEIAFRQQWIDAAQLETLAQPLTKNGYGQYLMRVLKEKVF